ncbi:hypothetical protein Bpfe_007162 [Biomphalaria pfeifferi]|uniref:Uncharacterized protein n=1 Tax=Biomphalaria pfeifferi TaxID=112525 RepID=A0AAD8BZ62_BIOPF|nr:hypothetical protein Bpfe_007162 [Biomphalaria pfeifferi]
MECKCEESHQDSPQESHQDSPQESSQDSPQESSQDSPQESSQDSPQESSQDSPQDSPQESSQDSPQDSPQESSQDSPQESQHPKDICISAFTIDRDIDGESNPVEPEPTLEYLHTKPCKVALSACLSDVSDNDHVFTTMATCGSTTMSQDVHRESLLNLNAGPTALMTTTVMATSSICA